MGFIPTDLPDVILIEPDVFQDARGFFLEPATSEGTPRAGSRAVVQDNYWYSAPRDASPGSRPVAHPQGELVRAVEGQMFDVAVDIRPWHPHSREVGRLRPLRRELPPPGSHRAPHTASA